MVHYFVCDDFAYKVVPITPLNETDRTTEPKFTVSCQSDGSLFEIFLALSVPFLAYALFYLCIVLSYSDPVGIFKQTIFSAYSWITTIICNIFFSIRNFFIRQNPAKYWPLPTSQASEETTRGSALLPFQTAGLEDGALDTTTTTTTENFHS
ncbi:hypothetical protein F5H01DRAFT_343999 [Linnemannia elongata]|nr:hypothetical protein F5H01DRAFT_343999 [Linnemannia elongata]